MLTSVFGVKTRQYHSKRYYKLDECMQISRDIWTVLSLNTSHVSPCVFSLSEVKGKTEKLRLGEQGCIQKEKLC